MKIDDVSFEPSILRTQRAKKNTNQRASISHKKQSSVDIETTMVIIAPNSEARKAAAALRRSTTSGDSATSAAAASASLALNDSFLADITGEDSTIVTPSATPTKQDVSTINCATEEEIDKLTMEHICRAHNVEMSLSAMVSFALISKRDLSKRTAKLVSLLCNNAIPKRDRLKTLMKSFTTEGDMWKSFAFDNTTTFFCSKSGLNQSEWGEDHVSIS